MGITVDIATGKTTRTNGGYCSTNCGNDYIDWAMYGLEPPPFDYKG